jgi:hypothetical protein
MRVVIVLAFTAAVLQPTPTEIRLIVKGDDIGALEVLQRRAIKLTSYRDLANK